MSSGKLRNCYHKNVSTISLEMGGTIEAEKQGREKNICVARWKGGVQKQYGY